MAISLKDNATFAGRFTAADADYPYGSSKDETSPGAGDGTQYLKIRSDDILGMQQSLLDEAGITPSGDADTVPDSQYKESIRTIINMRTTTHDMASDANYTLTDAQNRKRRVIITDTGVNLTTGRDIVVDDMEKRFIAVNETLQTLTFIIAGVGVDVAAGTTVELYNDGIDISVAVSGILTTENFIHVQDQKTVNTSGGTNSAGVTQTRTLNTVVKSTIAGASLSANEVILPAGDYYAEASAPGYRVNGHQLKIHDVTGAAGLLVGTSEFTGASYAHTTRSLVSGFFTLGVTSNIDTRQYTAVSDTDGLGRATNGGLNEVYTDVKIWKVG